jgi:hypothetical protein
MWQGAVKRGAGQVRKSANTPIKAQKGTVQPFSYRCATQHPKYPAHLSDGLYGVF